MPAVVPALVSTCPRDSLPPGQRLSAVKPCDLAMPFGHPCARARWSWVANRCGAAGWGACRTDRSRSPTPRPIAARR
jgi:hypothetical protein